MWNYESLTWYFYSSYIHINRTKYYLTLSLWSEARQRSKSVVAVFTVVPRVTKHQLSDWKIRFVLEKSVVNSCNAIIFHAVAFQVRLITVSFSNKLTINLTELLLKKLRWEVTTVTLLFQIQATNRMIYFLAVFAGKSSFHKIRQFGNGCRLWHYSRLKFI